MTAAAILLLLIVGVGALLYLHHRITTPRAATPEQQDPEPAADTAESECCGLHLACEKDSLVAGMDPELLYYDDEELDDYAGREADSYTPAEVEQFREVLLTLKPAEIASWARSITMRGIVMPAEVRDELLMIVAEARERTQPQPPLNDN